MSCQPSFHEIAIALGSAIGDALEDALSCPVDLTPEFVASQELEIDGIRVRISMKLEFL